MRWTVEPLAPGRMPGEAHISADEVIARLEEAGRTLLRLPPAGWSTEARTFWPDVVHDAAEAYGWTGATVRLPRPSAAEISAMDAAWRLLAYVPNDRYVMRRIVAARALVHPLTGRHRHSWRQIARLIGSHHMAAQRWHAEGVRFIVAGWNGAEAKAA